jgi:hypothetical protein
MRSIAPSVPMSSLASAYLRDLLNVMQNNSINRRTIDWTAFRAAVEAEAGAAQTIPDLFPASPIQRRSSSAPSPGCSSRPRGLRPLGGPRR